MLHVNFGLAEVTCGSEGFLHVLKETNRFLAPLAEHGGVCEVWQGRRGKNVHCRQTELLEKQIEVALSFPWMCQEVTEMSGSAWPSQAKTSHWCSQQQAMFGVEGTLLGSSWKGRPSILLHS